MSKGLNIVKLELSSSLSSGCFCFDTKYVSLCRLETNIILHNGYRIIVTSLERCGCKFMLLNLIGLGCFQYRPEPQNTPGIIMSYELGVGAGIAQYLWRLDYGLFGLGFVIRFLPGPRDFSLFQNVLAGFVAPPLPAFYSVCTTSCVPVIKRPGRETDFRYTSM